MKPYEITVSGVFKFISNLILFFIGLSICILCIIFVPQYFVLGIIVSIIWSIIKKSLTKSITDSVNKNKYWRN